MAGPVECQQQLHLDLVAEKQAHNLSSSKYIGMIVPPQGNPRYPKVENSGHWSISWWYQISYPQLSQLRVRLRPTVSGRTRALRCPPMRGGATSLWIGSVRSYLSASSWVKLVDPWNWENRRFFGGQYLRWRETRGLNPRRGSLGLNIHFQDPKTDVL